MGLEKIRCCHGGVEQPHICLNCAFVGSPHSCDYPVALIFSMYDEIVNGRGDTGDFSATQLQQCPRFIRLSREEGYSESPSDYYRRWKGKTVHSGVEHQLKDLDPDQMNSLTETRMYRTLGSTRISGTFDLLLETYSGGARLEDYKTTGRTTLAIKEVDDDYKMQASIYAWLLAGNGITVTSYKVWYLCSDGLVGLDVSLLPEDEIEDYLRNRIAAITTEELPDILPPRTIRRKTGAVDEQAHYKCWTCPLQTTCYAKEGLWVDDRIIRGIGENKPLILDDTFDAFSDWSE